MWIEIITEDQIKMSFNVTPLAGVWIEILNPTIIINGISVTPLAGVWIEISFNTSNI